MTGWTRILLAMCLVSIGCASKHTRDSGRTAPENALVKDIIPPPQSAQPAVHPVQTVPAEPATQAQPEKMQIAYSWPVGSTIRYRMLVDLQGHTRVDQMTKHSAVVTSMEFTLSPVSVDDKGITRVKCTYGSVDCLRQTEVKERWTSLPLAKGEEDTIQCQALRAMVGVSFDYLIASNGEITAIEGTMKAQEDARQKVLGKDPYVESALRTMFHEFSPEFIRVNLLGALRCIPEDGQVVRGQTWESKTTRPSQAGTILVDTTWRLEEPGTRAGEPAIVTGDTIMTLRDKGGFITSFYVSDITDSRGRARAEIDTGAGLLRRFRRETNLTFRNTTLPDKDPVQYKSHTQDVTEILELEMIEFTPAP